MPGKKLLLTVNGQKVEQEIPTNLRLLDFLRDYLRLVGTKEGCGEGECGACTVLVDGKPVNACLVMAHSCEGKEVLTIEGLGTPEHLHPLQRAFLDHGVVQCGFCAPGLILTGYALLKENPHPTRGEIKRAISGHLCRCTGYNRIIAAIESVTRREDGCDV